MKKQIMTLAWEMAKSASEKFGGSKKAYFAESLRITWANAKKAGAKADKKRARQAAADNAGNKTVVSWFWREYKLYKNNGGKREFFANNGTLRQILSTWTTEQYASAFGKYADFVSNYVA